LKFRVQGSLKPRRRASYLTHSLDRHVLHPVKSPRVSQHRPRCHPVKSPRGSQHSPRCHPVKSPRGSHHPPRCRHILPSPSCQESTWITSPAEVSSVRRWVKHALTLRSTTCPDPLTLNCPPLSEARVDVKEHHLTW